MSKGLPYLPRRSPKSFGNPKQASGKGLSYKRFQEDRALRDLDQANWTLLVDGSGMTEHTTADEEGFDYCPDRPPRNYNRLNRS